MSHDQTEAEPLGDICMSCGKKHPSQLWGATCSCRTPKMVVHLHKCNGCARVMGQRTDDDYCGPELLFCPDCVSAASKRGEEERLPRRRDDPSGAESAHASAVVALDAEPLRDRCRMKDMTCSSTAVHVACVVCGAVGHAGTGMWAVFHDSESRVDPHVCTGVCYRLYRARIAAAKTPQTIDEMLRDALAEGGAILADAKLSPAERVTKTNAAWSAALRKIIGLARADLVVEVEHLTKSLKRANEQFEAYERRYYLAIQLAEELMEEVERAVRKTDGPADWRNAGYRDADEAKRRAAAWRAQLEEQKRVAGPVTEKEKP